MIEEGQKLPEATLIEMGEQGASEVDLQARLKGRKVVIFAVPGAFTPTCSTAHLPSFIRTRSEFDRKGVDEVICISVNDAYVMHEWGKVTGASDAGIAMLADADGAFTHAIGMEFTAAPVGLIGRSQRYAMVVEDGKVTKLNLETERGVCDLTSGETILESL